LSPTLSSHDDAHKAAEQLLVQARAGECELRIPRVAVLESRDAVANAIRRFYEPFEKMRNAISKAFRNGVGDLNQIEAAMDHAAVRAYMKTDTESVRQLVLGDPSVAAFNDPLAELALMDTLSHLVRMGGMDVKDFYILAGVLADRGVASHIGRPAIFFSTNKNEFAPGTKVDASLYQAHRVVWRPDFQLVAGVKDWQKAFP
jgi:hypothetical protein